MNEYRIALRANLIGANFVTTAVVCQTIYEIGQATELVRIVKQSVACGLEAWVVPASFEAPAITLETRG